MIFLEYLFLFAELLMIIKASYMDVICRRYPNTLFLTMTGIGVVYAILCGHWVPSLFFFIIINLCGIFFLHSKLHIRAGDLKFFSTLFFILDPSDVHDFTLFIICLLAGMIVIGLGVLWNHYRNISATIDHIKRELESIGLLFLGYRDLAKLSTCGLESNKTVPFVAELGVISIIYIFIKGLVLS